MKKWFLAEDLYRACGIRFFAPGHGYAKDIPLKNAVLMIHLMPTDSLEEWLSDDQYAALVAGCSSFGLISISMELLRIRPAVQASPVYRL